MGGVFLPDQINLAAFSPYTTSVQMASKANELGPQADSIFARSGGGMAGTAGKPAPVASAGVYQGPFAGRTVGGEPFAVVLGVILLMIVLKFFSEHKSTLGGANPAFLKIGGFNFFAVGLSAMVFILVMKAITGRFQIPAVSEAVAAL